SPKQGPRKPVVTPESLYGTSLEPPELLDGRPSDAGPRRLTQKDFDEALRVVRQIYSAVEKEKAAGKPIDQEIIWTWSRRVLKAQLRASKNKEQRIAAFVAFVQRTHRMRDVVHELFESHEGTMDEVFKSMYYHNMATELFVNERFGNDAGWPPLE